MAFLPFQPLGLGEHEILGLLLGQCVAVAQGAGLVSGIFTRKRVVVRPVQGAVVIGVAERPPRRVYEGQDITCRTESLLCVCWLRAKAWCASANTLSVWWAIR